MVAGLLVLAVLGGLFAVIWTGGEVAEIERDHARQIERLEAEADVAEGEAAKLGAQAEADRANAELERAQGQRSRVEAMGRAIEAPALAAARAVDVQSEAVASMGRTNALMVRSIPVGVFIGFGCIALAALCLGLVGGTWLSRILAEQRKRAGVLKPRGDHNTDLFAGQDDAGAHSIPATQGDGQGTSQSTCNAGR